MATIVLLYAPCPSRGVAVRLTKQLLSARLIGCGKLMQRREYIMLAKTTAGKAAAARAFSVKHHPYEVPLIGQLGLHVNAAYARWLMQQVRSE